MDRLLCIQLLLLSTLTVSVSAFGVLPQSSSASLSTTTGSASPLQSAVSLGTFKPQHTVSSTRLYAGFGAGGGSSSNNKKKKKKKVVQKLKPKQQWDRYCDLKTENRVRVAVRLQEDASGESSDNDNNNNNNNNSEWLEVGRVKSKDNAYTELAVMKQKAIIAEHARRLFPLQVKANDRVEWAFWEETDENWTVVDSSASEDAPDGIERQIGFEGRPDPASGFYCHYNGGRLIDTNYDDQA